MAQEQKTTPPPSEDRFSRDCSLLDIEFTDEDEAILDRIWAEIPITEEERRKQRNHEVFRRLEAV